MKSKNLLAAGRVPLFTWFLCGEPLSDCPSRAHLYCYRSEANDLALRLARQYTGHQDVVVLDQ